MDDIETFIEDEYETPLGRAIATWRSGRHIGMDLAVQLMAEGFDVGALEERHFNHG